MMTLMMMMMIQIHCSEGNLHIEYCIRKQFTWNTTAAKAENMEVAKCYISFFFLRRYIFRSEDAFKIIFIMVNWLADLLVVHIMYAFTTLIKVQIEL